MKKFITAVVFMISIGTATNLLAQGLIDSGIRSRSAELERIKRESDQIRSAKKRSKISFKQIKADFEGIQIRQDMIIDAYLSGSEIDYDRIQISSSELVEMAVRLSQTLFAPNDKDGDIEPCENKDNVELNLKDLIVELDMAIARFTRNKIFLGMIVVRVSDSNTANSDLCEIIRLGRMIRTASIGASGKPPVNFKKIDQN